jgi:hypothetical protein
MPVIMKTSDGEVVDAENIFRLVNEWFTLEMKALWRHDLPGKGLLIGGALWGAEFVDRFVKYCLPSLVEPSNLNALAGNSRLLLYTSNESMQGLASLLRPLRGRGVKIDLRCIPDPIIKEVDAHRLNVYWLSGTLENLVVQEAGNSGMGCHLLFPDVIYARDFFKNLDTLAQKYEAVALSGLTADLRLTGFCEEIEKFRSLASGKSPGIISASARDLCDLGYRYLHPQHGLKVMNGRDIETDMPATTIWLAWQGREKVSIYTAHSNMTWLSPRLCAEAPVVIPSTVDAELPSFMPEFYVPKIEDGLSYIEVSGPEKKADERRLSFGKYTEQFWAIIKFNERYMPFFAEACEVPIHLRPDGLSDDQIEREQAAIRDRLEMGAAQAALAQLRQFGGADPDAVMPRCVNAPKLSKPVWTRRSPHGFPEVA